MIVLISIIIPYIQSDSQTHSLESTLQLVKLKNGDVLYSTIIEKDSASILLTTFFGKTDQISIVDISTIDPVSNKLSEKYFERYNNENYLLDIIYFNFRLSTGYPA
ncbi:MAG TPA: hypothetical protein VMV36_07650 [Ignavibacteriaceae bacterium]|nr:hypothetical protein [Ignavibacteriaceae bacterium]